MSNSSLDAFNTRILAHLQSDGRATNTALAEDIGLSATPCLRRVKALETDGVIEGYRATLNRKKVGLGITVFLGVRVEGHRAQNAVDAQQVFADIDAVVSCHVVSGESDFLLEVVVPDLEAYEEFVFNQVLTLPMVKDVRSNFVIRTVKDNAPLPLGHLAPPPR